MSTKVEQGDSQNSWKTCGFPMVFPWFSFSFQLRTSQELHLGDLRGVEGLHAPREEHITSRGEFDRWGIPSGDIQ